MPDVINSVSAELERARAAYQRGASIPAPALRNLEQRLGARFVAELSSRLSVAELTALGNITDVREAGLALARAGDIDAARERLGEAARLIDGLPTEEARISSHSFQLAASAFVEHKVGNHAAAAVSLMEALRRCGELRVRFAHSVEVRRIHLARNIARLEWVAGEPARSWRLLASLAGYAWHPESGWPLDRSTAVGPDHRERLRRDERLAVTDQILAEALNASAEAARRGVTLDDVAWRAALDADGWPERAAAIPRAGAALSAGHAAAGLLELEIYFEHGQGELPMTWRRAEQWLRELAPSR